MAQKTAPYGIWSSPITADALVQSSITLSDVLLDPVTRKFYHLEGRPSEGGRAVIVDTLAKKDVFGGGWDATTKVYEYGGGPATVFDGIVYFSNKHDGRVYSVAAAGAEPKAVTPDGKPYRYADFSVHPAHKHLVAAILEDHTIDKPESVVNKLVVINTKTRSLTTIASGADFYAAPRFSPDGAHIAYQEWNHPDMPWQRSAVHVFAFSVEDDKVTLKNDKRLAWDDREVGVGFPVWIDAENLVFLTDESGYVNPWTYSASSRQAARLLASPLNEDFAQPAFRLGWSPYAVLDAEKKTILFSALKGGRSVLYSFDWEAKALVPVDNPFVDVNAIRAIDAKTLVFEAKSTREPSAIIKLTITDTSTPYVTTTYEVLKSSMESLPFPDGIISQPEPLTLGTKSEPVYAILYLPTNPEYSGPSDPAEKPPCVVNSHGGPTSMAGQGLQWTKQYFTSRGWAWLDVDYSGSGGYGRKYIDRLNGAWGVADIADCAAASQALAEQGRIDAARTTIRGGSAGGFTTLAVLCHPALQRAFTAGTSLYGISDLTRLAQAGTHKFEARYMDKLIGGTVEQIPEVYAKRSPVNNAQNIRSPLLLLQGTEDKVVPPEQAAAIEKKIKEQRGHVEKIMFEGEGHGFVRADSIKLALESERDFYERMFHIGA
ncbi:alpha/beta-hydrolase [Gloeopeniophorella convolvens]|nr:alpha/beta-hydrolase [Gloeopeniophorella convolvens]